jgi:hypothetical protein
LGESLEPHDETFQGNLFEGCSQNARRPSALAASSHLEALRLSGNAFAPLEEKEAVANTKTPKREDMKNKIQGFFFVPSW